MRRQIVLSAVLSLIGAVGCGAGEPPTISQLTLPQQPVTLGAQAIGRLFISDPDGLGGMRLRMTVNTPPTTFAEVAVQNASDALTEAQVPFVFGLTASAPAGTYTLLIAAVDRDDNQSNKLSGTFTAQK